jgi:hypothetical protein
MLHCWKYNSSERPTFSQLEKTLGDVEIPFKKNRHNYSHLLD